MSEMLYRGMMRLLHAPPGTYPNERKNVVVLDEGDQIYDPVQPWTDLAATKSGILVVEPNVIRVPIAPHFDDENSVVEMWRKLADPFAVAALHVNDMNQIVGFAWPRVRLREYVWPEKWRGECTVFDTKLELLSPTITL